MSDEPQYHVGDSLIFWWFNETNQMSGKIIEIDRRGNYTVRSGGRLWVVVDIQIAPATDNMNQVLDIIIDI